MNALLTYLTAVVLAFVTALMIWGLNKFSLTIMTEYERSGLKARQIYQRTRHWSRWATSNLRLRRYKMEEPLFWRFKTPQITFVICLIFNLIMVHWIHPEETGIFFGRGWWLFDALIALLVFVAYILRHDPGIHKTYEQSVTAEEAQELDDTPTLVARLNTALADHKEDDEEERGLQQAATKALQDHSVAAMFRSQRRKDLQRGPVTRQTPFTLGVLVMAALLLWGSSWWSISLFAPYTNIGAQNIVQEVNITVVTDSYPESTPEQIPFVSPQMARQRASTALSSLGSFKGHRIETIYETREPVLQWVEDRAVYIVGLQFQGILPFNANKVDHTIPGYMVISATDPNAEVERRIGEEYEMRYVPGAFYGRNLDRILYWGWNDYLRDDITIEVNDDWIPYFTLAGSRYINGHIQKGVQPEVFLIADPRTGEVDDYTNFDEIPEWVDRVYSRSTVTNLMSWWGDYSLVGRWIFPLHWVQPGNSRVDVAGEPNLVFVNLDDGVTRAFWQVFLTSKGSDRSTSVVALFDARTGETRIYDMRGTVSLESVALEEMAKVNDNPQGHLPVDARLFVINGVPSWVASYIGANDVDNHLAAFAGVGIVPAANVQGSSTIFGESWNNVLRTYLQHVNDPAFLGIAASEDNSVEITGEVFQVGNLGELKVLTVFTDNGELVGNLVGDINTGLALATIEPGTRVTITYTPGDELVGNTINSIEVVSPAPRVTELLDAAPSG